MMVVEVGAALHDKGRHGCRHRQKLERGLDQTSPEPPGGNSRRSVRTLSSGPTGSCLLTASLALPARTFHHDGRAHPCGQGPIWQPLNMCVRGHLKRGLCDQGTKCLKCHFDLFTCKWQHAAGAAMLQAAL